MPGETIEYQADAPDTASSVWITVARQAGYLDSESLWTPGSFVLEETSSGRASPHWAISFLKHLVVLVQHWFRR